MKPECPIDWKTAFTAALLGFLGAYLIGGYLNMPDAGAIVAIAYVGGRILWYLKRLEPVRSRRTPLRMLPPIPQLPIRRRRAVAPKDNGYPRTAAGRGSVSRRT